MPTKKTPPMYARGRYVLTAPWDSLIDSTKTYTCIAIRSFKDIYEDGLDVEKEFYNPNGLVNGQNYAGSPFSFDGEKEAQANIITLLRDDNQQYIYVPDTYIAAYPSMADVKYNQIILSMNFGAMPDYLDLSAIKTTLASSVGAMIGKTPTVNEHRAPSANTPTPVQHDALEGTRIGSITNRETDYVKIKRLEQLLASRDAQITKLTAILTLHGWLPP